MATSAYTHKHRQGRQISLTKVAVIAANVALWAGLIGVVALIAG